MPLSEPVGERVHFTRDAPSSWIRWPSSSAEFTAPFAELESKVFGTDGSVPTHRLVHSPLYVTPEGAALLTELALHGRVHCLAMFAHAGRGNSSMLNFVADTRDAFAVATVLNECRTRGVWLRVEVSASGGVLLLLDCEGHGSCNTLNASHGDEDYIARLRALCALLAPVVALNQENLPNQETLNNVALLSIYASKLQAEQAAPDRELIFLIRDHHLRPAPGMTLEAAFTESCKTVPVLETLFPRARTPLFLPHISSGKDEAFLQAAKVIRAAALARPACESAGDFLERARVLVAAIGRVPQPALGSGSDLQMEALVIVELQRAEPFLAEQLKDIAPDCSDNEFEAHAQRCLTEVLGRMPSFAPTRAKDAIESRWNQLVTFARLERQKDSHKAKAEADWLALLERIASFDFAHDNGLADFDAVVSTMQRFTDGRVERIRLFVQTMAASLAAPSAALS